MEFRPGDYSDIGKSIGDFSHSIITTFNQILNKVVRGCSKKGATKGQIQEIMETAKEKFTETVRTEAGAVKKVAQNVIALQPVPVAPVTIQQAVTQKVKAAIDNEIQDIATKAAEKAMAEALELFKVPASVIQPKTTEITTAKEIKKTEEPVLPPASTSTQKPLSSVPQALPRTPSQKRTPPQAADHVSTSTQRALPTTPKQIVTQQLPPLAQKPSELGSLSTTTLPKPPHTKPLPTLVPQKPVIPVQLPPSPPLAKKLPPPTTPPPSKTIAARTELPPPPPKKPTQAVSVEPEIRVALKGLPEKPKMAGRKKSVKHLPTGLSWKPPEEVRKKEITQLTAPTAAPVQAVATKVIPVPPSGEKPDLGKIVKEKGVASVTARKAPSNVSKLASRLGKTIGKSLNIQVKTKGQTLSKEDVEASQKKPK